MTDSSVWTMRILAPRHHALSNLANRPQGHFSVWVRLFPIVFFIGYLSLTVFLFMFGPWTWPVRDGTMLWLFLVLAHFALLAGYISGAFGRSRSYSGKWQVSRMIIVSAILNLLILFPTSKFRTGSFIPNPVAGIVNPGAAYESSQDARTAESPVVEYVRLLLGPWLYLVMPLGIFYWGRLRPLTRLLVLVSVFSTVILFLAMGTNKAIAETVLLAPWLLIAGHLSNVSRLKRRHVAVLTLIGATCFALFLTLFSIAMATRSGSAAALGRSIKIGSRADYNNFMIRNLSAPAQIGVLGLSDYLCQGYYALYLSLREPWVPTFGVGNSIFLTRQAARLTGDKEILEMPYPMRIEKRGWDAYGLWSSFYPWIASDVSFPGTIVVVFLIGYLFARSWLDVLRGENPFAILMFANFLTMLYYFPASNPVLQDGEGVATFCILFFLWRSTSRHVTVPSVATETL